jgi:hypothetical protein
MWHQMVAARSTHAVVAQSRNEIARKAHQDRAAKEMRRVRQRERLRSHARRVDQEDREALAQASAE